MLHFNRVVFGLNKQYNSTGVVITIIVIDRENKIYVIREVTLIEKSDFPSYTINYCKQILATLATSQVSLWADTIYANHMINCKYIHRYFTSILNPSIPVHLQGC